LFPRRPGGEHTGLRVASRHRNAPHGPRRFHAPLRVQHRPPVARHRREPRRRSVVDRPDRRAATLRLPAAIGGV